MDILSKKVVRSVISQYSSLKSYIGEAVVETTYNKGIENEWTSKILLRTVFKSPNLFRFDRRIGMKKREQSIVVWFDGKNGYISDSSRNGHNTSGVFSAFKRPETRTKDCLNHCFVFSGVVNTILHPLFFLDLHQHCELERENWICDLSAEHYLLRTSEMSIQVERESLLINKIVEYRADTTVRELTIFTSHALNEEIEPSMFDRRIIQKDLTANQILYDFRSKVGALVKVKADGN